MKKGKQNTICDIAGIRVGHKTCSHENIQTGVSILIPREDIFMHKCPAAVHVINGYGKTTGLLQIEELGTLESPIALTNTLSVGIVQQALVKYMLKQNKEIGLSAGTINVVVGECNDSYLNDIRACAVCEQDVYDAIQNASADFALGSAGAGRGMSCFEMKGGIGSSSRIVSIGRQNYTIGALVLTNFGRKQDFSFSSYDFSTFTDSSVEQGSIIILLATDIPLSSRQLKRLCKRMPIALAKTGSWMGNGSGDIVIAFSTGVDIPHFDAAPFQERTILNESYIDLVFRAGIEACEEAIYSSLLQAQTTIGRDGHIRYSLQDTLKKMQKTTDQKK